MLTEDQDPARTGESSDTPPQSAPPASGRRYVPPGRPSGPPQLDFPPVRNGIDYLASVVEHLDENESDVGPRDLKYAVLHLQAAVEVLLKARLLREHWSLIFKDPGRATRKNFESGDFESCGTDAAVERLRDIAGITIDRKEVEALKDLTKDRNALQHYGLTHNAGAVEARAGRVLDFLMRFLDTELLPLLQGPERERAMQDMIPVDAGVKNISSYVTRRLNRLRGELAGLESQTIMCPTCEQMTLVVAPQSGDCRFCTASWDSAELLVFDYLVCSDGQLARAYPCPQCDTTTFVEGVNFVDGPRLSDTLYCFGCAARHEARDLANCSGCSRPWPIEADVDGSDTTLCPDCWNQVSPEDVA
ncbi:hypothetical protein [Streptomyces sp. GbtcB6]|uniref:hypothetical protein n=1 Tax=Streptomyces sp. GbtcB6 TaxID=2824751 RepID=UPI001C2FBA7B|nr:hypothetical protein [Streptomyces sp. GbtcB6]